MPLAVHGRVRLVENGYYMISPVGSADIKKRHLSIRPLGRVAALLRGPSRSPRCAPETRA